MPDPAFPTHLILEDFGKLSGRVWREAGEVYDRDALLQDLVAGEYDRPVRIIALDPDAERCADVSAQVAAAMVRRALDAGEQLVAGAVEFAERHGVPVPDPLRF